MKTFNPHNGINVDTIAAVATPAGVGGIGIVRISGCSAVQIARKLFSKSKNAALTPHTKEKRLQTHRLIHGYIKEPLSQNIVDEVLMVVMRGPHSYTNEDVVEIQSHGGLLIVSKILELVIQQGARLAEPGEFTRRAFLNGRIDLSQAEAVADIINAKSAGAHTVASQQLNGRLRDRVRGFREALVSIIADLEAGIEFPDELDPQSDQDRGELAAVLDKEVAKPVHKLIESYKSGRVLREGLRLAIVGRPNVGKSSLMNCLIGREKAIVTPIPGTTRDTVEEMVHIGNVEMHVADTAGLHESSDPVEIIGMRKTRESIAIADFILMVVESHQPVQKEDLAILDQIDPVKTIVVRNKIDLCAQGPDFELPNEMSGVEMVSTSAKEGIGIDDLKKRVIEKCLHGKSEDLENLIVANARHKDALELTLSLVMRAQSAMLLAGQEDMVSMDLTQALGALENITGDRIEEEVLDSIFAKFCIGK